MRLQSCDKLHIDVAILDPGTQAPMWRFTGFYGEPRRELRGRSWDCLKFLNTQSELPWLCTGDFNKVLEAHEQFGGQSRSERQMDGFREAVQVCGLMDLGFIGLPYTWDNRQEGSNNVKVRLDRGLANPAFLDLFRDTKVWHVQTTESDHCCLLLECFRAKPSGRRARRRFRYENMWRRDPSYTLAVESAWQEPDDQASMSQLANRLGELGRSLSDWDHTTFGSVRKNLAKLRKDLERIRGQSLGTGPSRDERRVMKQISEMLSREEEMEKQRSRVEWLREGDRNTAFFQAKSRERAKCNQINALLRADGVRVSEQADIEEMARQFYTELFTAQELLETDTILNCVPRKVTPQMNEELMKPFAAEEVHSALFMMGPNKAPGPDGFTAGFFQYHWHLLGPSITRAVLNFLNGGELPSEVNMTTIVLIPKIKNPQEMKNFRPISLCNVIYKICSKILANRLRCFLDEIISEEQSAFVPGRLITDNMLIAYECTHYLKRKKGKLSACAVKLDMAKAYDRFEWVYLQRMMLRLGFHEVFVSLVMRCVTSVSLSVRVNGVLTEPFRPTRGIRQGDPISPYLFLLCAEGLSSLLKSRGPVYLSRGVRVGIHAPWISHLLFADDCIVFSEASQRGASRL